MFLKRKRPETDDFAGKKCLVVKEKFQPSQKKSENVFAYSYITIKEMSAK